jgi:Mg2+ and Co2+ transporter CorA
MIKKHTHKNISWLEIDNPDKQDIKEIISEYKIDPSIASEIELPTYKEKIILSKNYIYMVMHFPALRHSHKKSDRKSILLSVRILLLPLNTNRLML